MLETLDQLVREAGAAGLLFIALGAFVEYVFPPFPGDTVTVLSGLYAVRGGWPLALVFALVMAGSLAGAFLDYLVGRWLSGRLERASPDGWLLRRVPREAVAAWGERFRRRGVFWLVVNRFLPAVRGPIFLAAGVARMAAWKVVVFGGLSALSWNALLFGAGWAVGGHAERLLTLIHAYERVAWVALALVGLVFLARWLWPQRSRAGTGSRPTP
jgi:membrane protein DedA with SNARE-associated domain